MYKSKRESVQRQSKAKSDISQFGLFAVPDMDGMDDGDDDDPELEAELLRILSSGNPAKARSQQHSAPKKGKVVGGDNLEQMIAQSLRDIPSDESSGDEDDPSLLAELKEYTGEEVREAAPPEQQLSATPTSVVPLLNERIEMYKAAGTNAKLAGDTAKARRLERGLKTLGELLRKAERGVPIDEGEIPLPVAVPQAKPPSAPQPETIEGGEAPPPVPPRRSSSLVGKMETEVEGESKGDSEREEILTALRERMNQYKKAAVLAKKAGDLETAKAHVRVIKQFEAVISGVENGEKVELSSMPPPPSIEPPPGAPPPPSAPPPMRAAPPAPVSPPPPVPAAQAPSTPPRQEGSEVSESPLSVLDALEQRLAVFRKQEETAKTDGNSSKARRMGRIAKQYEDAIRLHKVGKEFPVDELPTPPVNPHSCSDDFNNILMSHETSCTTLKYYVRPYAPRGESGDKSSFPPIPVTSKSEAEPKKEGAGPVQPIQHTPPSQRPAPAQPSPSALPSPRPPPSPNPSTSSISPKVSGRTTRQEKQLAILLKRQKEWKEAAIAAKKSGDLAKAKDCLRQAKGFDALIEASHSGLPVDLTTIPVPPNDKIENDFEIVNVTDCLPSGTNSEIYDQLKSDLKNQFKMCMETRAHYKALGDVGNANKFEQLAVHTKKDLDRVTVLHDKNDPLPRFHYEMRNFSIVRSNTDLNDNDLELSIIQGVNYNVPNPKEIDTYVRYEFPFPSDDPKKDKTSTVYNTNNPEYNTTVVIPIVRNSRACQRVFKRHALKLEVWSKGGFLRSDTLVGTVNIKLQSLETKCTIHDSFNLMDGRKPVGGKLEVKIRLRHPIQEKEVEQVKEKWLLID